MNAPLRILHVAYGVAALAGVGVLAVLWFSWEPALPAVAWLMSWDWFFVVEAVLLGIVAAGALASLVVALAAPRRKRQLTVEREAGNVAIARNALQSTVRNTVEAHRELNLDSATVTVRGKHSPRLFVHAKVKPGRSSDLGALGSRLQNEIGLALEAFTGYPVQEVAITFAGDAPAPAAPQRIVAPAAAPKAVAGHA